MKQLVSGESDAKGLSVILPYIAVGPAAVAIRRPELLKRLELGSAGSGSAWPGRARHGTSKARNMAGLGSASHGMARPERGKELGLA